MISAIVAVILLSFLLHILYGLWTSANTRERWYVVKAVGRVAVVTAISLAILLVIVNIF